jgi:predicted DsbA family dithiol-disulfide isomerase
LNRELEQLEKTYKAGIIPEREFEKGKERIEMRMSEIEDKVVKDRESKKIVQEILAEPERKTPESKEPRTPKTAKKKAVPKPRREAKTEPTDGGGIARILIFALVALALLVAIIWAVFNQQPAAPVEKNLTYNGTATLEMFIDTDCPYSKDAWMTALQLKSIYGDHLAVTIMHFPMSEHSLESAIALQCSRDQEKHIGYTARLFENMGNITNDQLIVLAGMEGMDAEEFNSCFATKAHIDTVRDHMQEGIDRGVRSAPTMFLDGEMVIGSRSLEFWKAKLDEKLAVK